MTARRLLLCAGVLTTLAGCTTLRPDTVLCQRSGRFQLADSRDGETRTQSGKWLFVRTDRTTELSLLSPLGGMLARASVDSDGAELEVPSQQIQMHESSAQDLLMKTIGFPLPVELMDDWLAGKPANQHPHRAIPNGFEQQGVRLTVRSRHPDGSPRLIDVIALAQPFVSLRLVVSEPTS